MKVITNQGEYATVTKSMSNHFEIRCDNGVTKLIEKHRCEVLVPISRVKEVEKNLHNLQEKHVKVATEIHKLHFELGENIECLESKSKLSDVLLADLNRCKRVNDKLEKILSL
jgi:predicted transcriptional regulator